MDMTTATSDRQPKPFSYNHRLFLAASTKQGYYRLSVWWILRPVVGEVTRYRLACTQTACTDLQLLQSVWGYSKTLGLIALYYLYLIAFHPVIHTVWEMRHIRIYLAIILKIWIAPMWNVAGGFSILLRQVLVVVICLTQKQFHAWNGARTYLLLVTTVNAEESVFLVIYIWNYTFCAANWDVQICTGFSIPFKQNKL